jgi:hypothetical protein
MELLVVLGVFSMAVAMASAVFIQSSKVQRRVLAQTSAQTDLRFALEAMVREVRGGLIDYAAYENEGGVQIPTDHLWIKSASGNELKFFTSKDPVVCPSGIVSCLAVSVGGSVQSMTSSGITLQNLTFYVSPQTDPFSLDAASGLYKADAQPVVTIAMRVKAGSVTEGQITLDAQTSVASRTYAR